MRTLPALAAVPIPELDLTAGVALAIAAAGVLLLALIRRRRGTGDDDGGALPALLLPAPAPGQAAARARRLTLVVMVLVVLTAAGYVSQPWWRSGGPGWAPERALVPLPLASDGAMTGESAAPELVELRADSDRPVIRPAGRLPGEGPPAEPVESRREVRDPESGERLLLWDGDDQEAVPGRFLRTALSVVLRSAEGQPLPGREVRFAVAKGGGRVDPAVTRTTTSGLALARWWPGSDPDSLRVIASVEDRPALRMVFTARLPEGFVAPAAPLQAPDAASEAAADGEALAASDAPLVVAATPALPLWSAGGVHTCRVIPPLDVGCWGGSDQAASTPRSQATPRAVVAGVSNACAILEDGAIPCWPVASGAGVGVVTVRMPSGRPVQVAAGSDHVCALASTGAVFCWGANDRGQLGTGDGEASRSPVRVDGLPPVVQITSGWLHSCALTATGAAYCWGANYAGQRGDGTTSDGTAPTAVGPAEPFTAIAAGSSHTCALTPAGAAWCWGRNEAGQLGTGARSGSTRPARVAAQFAFRAIVTGGVHTCGLTRSGQAWCWGGNTFGQLGNGTLEDARTPEPVSGSVRFTRLSAGGAHTCGETSAGELRCWGGNIQGQLGDGTRENRLEPVEVPR